MRILIKGVSIPSGAKIKGSIIKPVLKPSITKIKK